VLDPKSRKNHGNGAESAAIKKGGDPKGFGRFLLVSLLKPRGLKRGQTLHFFLRVFSGEEMTKCKV
jgi:hypothetical protein